MLAPEIKLVKLPTLNLADEPSKLKAFQWRWLTKSLERWEFLSSLSGKFPDIEAFGLRFLKWHKKHGDTFDIVLDNQTLSYASLKLQAQRPLITTIHHPITRDLKLAVEAEPSLGMRFLIRRWYSFLKMQIKVAAKLDRVIVPSSKTKIDIQKDFSVAEKNIKEIPLGVDQEIFRPIESIKRDPFRIISTVSADAPLKGMIYLLKAFNILRKKHPKLRLTLIGKPKVDSPADKFIKAHNLSSKIDFQGYLEEFEIVERYAASTLAVIPSLYEGFCLPAVEAMACGVPLVATRAGAIPQTAGDAALYCDAGNAHQLAENIEKLLTNTELQQKLSLCGKKRVAECYNWSVVAKEMTDAFHQTIEEFQEKENKSLSLNENYS